MLKSVLRPRPRGIRFTNYHAEDLDVEENCFILDNQSISLDVNIGNNVVMCSSNHIGDLITIGDDSWFASSPMGIGGTLGNKLMLGQRTFVSANPLVASNTKKNSVHVSSGSEAVGADNGAFMRVNIAKDKL